MRTFILYLIATAAVCVPASQVAAQVGSASHVCLAIDEGHDMFSSEERQAALILVARQFEQAGFHVVKDACGQRYTLSHVRLGNTIIVTLSGSGDARDGKAAGMDDLPALYSQLVRAILTGSSVGAMDVIDRTNVTTPQAHVKRVRVDSFGYARLGYGTVLGAGGSQHPAMGFGYRAELDTFALDVSFLNQQLPSSNGGYGSSGGMAGSFIRLEGLRFARPKSNASAYFGGGLSWGATSGASSSSANSYSSWSGSGLQGELTAGYEVPRATDLRVFFQADAALPFYSTRGQTVTYSASRTTTVTTGRRYNPAITLSIGIGWQRHRT
jgi:hypothetical protein